MNQVQLMEPTQESGFNSPAVSSGTAVEQSRAVQEVQGAIIMAKKFPRDENAAFARVMTACKRKSLAEVAMYAYPRGGQTVTGASIRLAETIAKAWGNIQFGIVELEQDTKAGRSEIMTYAWDLETNTREVKSFTVPHERHTKAGVKKLTDPRDVYELIANQAARRLRSCIFGVLPGDVVEEAVGQCEKTLQGQSDEPLIDRVRKAVVAFGEFGVTQAMIEKRLAHKLDATSIQELVNLQKIYRSLKDGMASVSDFFEAPEVVAMPEKKEKAKAQPDHNPETGEVTEVVVSKTETTEESPADETPLVPLTEIDVLNRTTERLKFCAKNMVRHLERATEPEVREAMLATDPDLLKELSDKGLGRSHGDKIRKALGGAA